MPTKAQLNRMGKAILDFEARRDSRGRLAVYPLPTGDGGGRIEVAGINDRYHPVECAELVRMIRDRKYDEAEKYARNFMIRYTDAVTTWMPIGMDPGIEFFLRDSAFNRGPAGAAMILQIALGVKADGRVGQVTRGALASSDSKELLNKLRGAREQYEHRFRGERSKFWRGLVNRWNKAYSVAKQLQGGT
jgi:hypothetical protein